MSNTDLIIAQKIREKLGSEVLQQLKTEKTAKFTIPKRSLDNSKFDEKQQHLTLGDQTFERNIKDASNVKSFAQTLEVGKSIVDALEQNIHPTIRRIYYNVKPSGLFKETKKKGRKGSGQSESDEIIKDIEVMTGFLREDMGILTKAKGEIIGNITMEAVVKKETKMVDLSKVPFPMFIPSCADRITIKDVKASMVLIIEKDTEYNELVDSGLHEDLNCIMITGGGQPDRGTRRLVRRLNGEWHLPVAILTDLDPAGWGIFGTYKYGSIGLSYESEKLACPNAKYLGMLPSDIEKYDISDDDIIEAEDWDLNRAKSIMNNHTWMLKDISKEEIELFLKEKKKAELESFSSKSYKFLQETYIPDKLKQVGLI